MLVQGRRALSGVATCLRDLARAAPHGGVASIEMSGSPDLVCNNLMCEQLGGACVCRLARFMDALPQVERIVLAQNNLTVLPDSVWDRTTLRELDLSSNLLQRLPKQIAMLCELKVLRVADNSISDLPDELFHMASLEEIDVRGNPLTARDIERLVQMGDRRANLRVTIDNDQ